MFKENYIITGKIVCKTGLRIGGSSDAIDIGGNDNPIIRDSVTGLPYIPGSSLKGKLRFLTELNDIPSANNIIYETEGDPSNDETCIAAKLFGVSARKDINTPLKFPTRTIVRDAFPDEETIKLWDTELLMNGAELKWENNINRITSFPNPRNNERVPRGSKFNFEIIFTVYENEENNIVELLNSMQYLEDNYLGASGSRGYGQIKFEEIELAKRTIDYYKEDAEEISIAKSNEIKEIINEIK